MDDSPFLQERISYSFRLNDFLKHPPEEALKLKILRPLQSFSEVQTALETAILLHQSLMPQMEMLPKMQISDLLRMGLLEWAQDYHHSAFILQELLDCRKLDSLGRKKMSLFLPALFFVEKQKPFLDELLALVPERIHSQKSLIQELFLRSFMRHKEGEGELALILDCMQSFPVLIMKESQCDTDLIADFLKVCGSLYYEALISLMLGMYLGRQIGSWQEIQDFLHLLNAEERLVSDLLADSSLGQEFFFSALYARHANLIRSRRDLLQYCKNLNLSSTRA